MKTKRALSGITFNTPSFFKYTVLDLYYDGLFDWVYWIVHQPDKDDKKMHIHFSFQPSRIIDTASIPLLFLEFPFYGETRLPLKPLSKFQFLTSLDDWLLYCKHDVSYLNSKGLERDQHYDWSDFLATDLDALLHDINNIDYTKISRLAFLNEGVLNGIPFAQLIQTGQLPIQYRSQYEAQYNALRALRGLDLNL